MTAGVTVPVIGAQLRHVAERKPDATAITCSDESITWRELEASTNRLARAYQAHDVEVGDYVTIALPNSIEWLQAVIAVWKIGAIPQPLSTRLPPTEFDGLLALVPRALLVGRDDPHGTVPSVPAGFTPSLEFSDASLPDAVSPSWKAMASGGSTGRPKLIEAAGDSRLDAHALGELFAMREGDVQLVCSPLTHNTPFALATLALLLGQHLVLMPRFEPVEFLRLITRHRVEFLGTVPTIMQRALAELRERPEVYDLSSIRRMWHMAAPCPGAVKRAWIDILGPDAVWELYGGTELQAMTFISGGEWLEHPGSVGRVGVGEMKVLDDDGHECPPEVVGEVYMRPGPAAAPTYRYIGHTATSRDGWDTIGDAGHFDADGYLYLSDRTADVFNVGGRKVYPAEIEGALGGHPDVLSCLVVGVPDDDLGQVPYAIVHAKPGSPLDAAGVRDFAAEHLAGYKVPRGVEFRNQSLRDDAGKARRSAVRQNIIERLRCSAEQGPST